MIDLSTPMPDPGKPPVIKIILIVALGLVLGSHILKRSSDRREEKIKRINRELAIQRDSIEKQKDSIEQLQESLNRIQTDTTKIHEKFRDLRSAGIDNPTGDSLAREILKRAPLQGFD